MALLALALLLLAVLFGRLFVDPFFYFSTDNAELYFPWLVMLSRALHHADWPFLNPYAFAGSLPFAPLESGALYPVTLLAGAFVSPTWPLDSIYFVFLGLSFLHYLLGACCMYALLRRPFALGASASTFGALCYAFSGSFVGRFSHQPVLYALAWLPLAVGATMAFTKGGALRTGALAVLAVWLMGAGSHPQVFLYGLATVTGAVVWFALAQDRTRRWGALRRGATALALALGLLGPRILPLVEFSRVAARPTPAFTIASLFDSLSPLYYLTLLAPGVFGRHMRGYWGTDHPLGNWDSLLYLGVLAILCTCFAVLHRRRRDWTFALAGAGIAVFLMLGTHCAASSWVDRHLPLSQALTGLSKLTIVLHFFLVLLAAFGVQALLAGKRRACIVLAAAIACVVIAIFAWLSPEVVASLAPASRRAPSEEAVRFALQSVRQARALALVSFCALLAAIFFPRAGMVLFVPVLVLDLALSLGDFNPIEVSKGEPATYYGRDAGTRVMQNDPDVFRVAGMEPPNAGMVFALETIWGYHTIATSAYASVQPLLDVHDRRNRPMYNLANIKYQRLESDLSSQNFSRAASDLWLNREVLPRAFFAGRCRGFPDMEAMASHARSASFDPSREVMLFAADCPRSSGDAGGSCALRSAAESRERYSADCTVDAGGGWVVFSVVQYPGWTAAVNGRPADLVPADIAFYAVPLDTGQHHVELVYRSRGLLYGLWLAAGTSLLAAGLVVWRIRRSGRGTAPSRSERTRGER